MTATSSDSRSRLLQTSIVLVLVNLIPLAGALVWSWSVFEIVLLYWMENLVVGLYALLRIQLAGGPPFRFDVGRVFLGLFFVVHYGMFCLVHGVFVFALLGREQVNSISGAIDLAFTLRWAILAIFLSHGYSFVRHYLLGGESVGGDPPNEMQRPYPRMIVLHVAIIFGAFAVQALGSPMGLLLILVIGKTLLDLKLHRRAHTKSVAAGN